MKYLIVSSEDEFLPEYIGSQMNWKVNKNIANYGWYFSFNDKASHSNVWVQDFLKQYPELLNTKSETKFIPEEYLYGSIEQRFDLLSGLLDTDGSVDAKGRISYFTISPFLRDNVIELCHSLGLKTAVSVDNHKDTSTCFVIRITGRPEDKVKLFKLPRKKETIMAWCAETFLSLYALLMVEVSAPCTGCIPYCPNAFNIRPASVC